MAKSNSDGSIVLSTKIDESGLKKGFSSIQGLASKAAKSFTAISIAAAASTVAITKMAVSAYADYEQLVGGVETLFKGSAQKVLEYANDAFYTVGISANEYMQQVTSFSASLIRSTAGDTDKAADIANMALIDMSDNANKMGSSMESVTLAYQGFAKQQYQLLDNLKLGYGGTKTEMERLLKDAQALTGVKYDINNLADVYSAIHAIQEELGIAGTTAKEAEKTITGSANMMKAAWQNVLSAIAGGGDLDRAINNLVYSVSKFFGNIVPVVQRSLVGIGALIEQVAPMIVQTVASALIQAIPSLTSAIYQMIIGFGKGIWQGVKALFSGGASTVTSDISASVGGIADATVDATSGMEALGDATEDAGKKAQKSLAGFDELNSLSQDGGSAPTSTPQISVGGGGSAVPLNIEQTTGEASALEGVLGDVFDRIRQSISSAWNSTPVQAFWSTVRDAAANGLAGFRTIGENLWNNLKTTWNNISGDFGLMTTNMSNLWTMFWQDIQIGINTWGQPIIDSISGVFDSIWTTAVSPVIELLVGAWTDFTGILSSKWEEYGQPLVDKIGQFATNVINFFQSIYDNVLAPIITPLLETMSSLWDEHISGMVDKLVDFIMKLVDGALEIYNEFIHPIVMWISETLGPIFTWIGDKIGKIFGTIISTVSGVLGGIFDALGGLIDFVVGIFTGDWERAWEGIKNFFSGIWDAIWSAIKGVINLIIDGLNALWSGLYGALAGIINGVGGLVEDLGEFFGADWGWEIPTNPPLIPKLAQGAVIPGGREFLAVLGDQPRGQTNIEAPLDTIKQAVAEVLAQVNVGGGSNGKIEVPVIIDGREVARAVREAEGDMGSRTVVGGFANAY